MTLPSARDPAVRALPPRQRQAYLRYLDEGDQERALGVLERSPIWRAARSRLEAQEAENVDLLRQGTGLLEEAERALRRSLRAFRSIRIAGHGPERREMRFLVGNIGDALAAVRRAKRGSLVDFRDPDLAIRDRDLEG